MQCASSRRQVVLFAILLFAGWPQLYFFLWFLPYMTEWRVINRLRSIAEHGGMQRSNDRRLTTHSVRQSLLARFFMVPYNIGYHLAHHVDMGVPWRKLPQMHAELVEAGWIVPDLEYPTYRALVAQAVVPTRLIALLSSWTAEAGSVAAAADDLIARYREPHRRYHTLEHIEEMLAVTDRLDAVDDVTCAVWFHDVDVRAGTRRQRDARALATRVDVLGSLGAPPPLMDEVERLVETTRLHEPDRRRSATGIVLADADLAILGSRPERYERYVRDVRAEYAHVSDDDWQRGRAAVVQSFLDRPRLYHAPWMFDTRATQRARQPTSGARRSFVDVARTACSRRTSSRAETSSAPSTMACSRKSAGTS